VKLRVTTLSENTAGSGNLLAEWGLCILVETDEANILLDSGASFSASHNADVLGIDLSKIDKIVLSHGHYDHTGGLRHILRKVRKEVEIIAHPDIWANKYARSQGQKDRYIGIPFPPPALESLGARFYLSVKPTRITDSIMTTGEIPMVTDFEQIEPDRFFVKEGTGWQPDELRDDQALIIDTGAGLVVILGCAHRGVINTLYHAQKLTGVSRVLAVLGGCHLVSASKERIHRTIAALDELGIQKAGLSHCTGLPAAVIMARALGDRFFFNNAGTRLDLP